MNFFPLFLVSLLFPSQERSTIFTFLPNLASKWNSLLFFARDTNFVHSFSLNLWLNLSTKNFLFGFTTICWCWIDVKPDLAFAWDITMFDYNNVVCNGTAGFAYLLTSFTTFGGLNVSYCCLNLYAHDFGINYISCHWGHWNFALILTETSNLECASSLLYAYLICHATEDIGNWHWFLLLISNLDCPYTCQWGEISLRCFGRRQKLVGMLFLGFITKGDRWSKLQ